MYPLPNVGSGPDGFTTGPGGSVWFAEHDGNRIGRFSP
jgi:streptogramin lyase